MYRLVIILICHQSNNILNLQGNRQNSNRCATLAEFFHDLKTGGSEVKGLLITKCSKDI